METTDTFTLWIAGKPKGKDRARTTRTGHTFTPKATENAEANVVQIWREAGEPRLPDRLFDDIRTYTPVRMDALILVERPASHFNSKGELNVNGQRHPLPENQKPDVDNLLKLVMDALNKRAYKDDVQITTSNQKRRWASVSGVMLTISIDHDEADYDR